MKERIKDWDMDKLEFLLEHKNVSTDAKGIGTGDNGDVGELNDDPNPNDPQKQQEELLNNVDSMFDELKPQLEE